MTSGIAGCLLIFGVMVGMLASSGLGSNALQYTVADDLGNVINLDSFPYLTAEQKTSLAENGFVVAPDPYEDIYEIYKSNHKSSVPTFITTDVMLHTSHILFDYLLRAVEITELTKSIGALTEAMLSTSIEQHRSSEDICIKEATKKNIAYFAVASELLQGNGEIPDLVREEVNAELSLIAAHRGFASSPIFGYDEDYSQYVPRGHYTRNEEFRRFFKAMMWYGRMMFRLQPGEDAEAVAKGKEETLQALLIVYGLDQAEASRKAWKQIYDATALFVGKTDDLDVCDYTGLTEQVYGTISSIGELSNEARLEEFIANAKEYKKPEIVSSLVIAQPGEESKAERTLQGFRFMGQRFIPDSYMFQQLVYNKVGTPEKPRYFPKGLDIMTVLGSEKAEEILREEGDFEYISYQTQLEKLKREFAQIDETGWTQNLYWNWLHSLQPLLDEKGEGHPLFMQNNSWLCKELHTALASWAELRHDTILYAKQSYALAVGLPPSPQLTKGYVEPYPSVYARLAGLVRQMREELSSLELLTEEIGAKLLTFEKLLLTLKSISDKELVGQTLTDNEYEAIWNIGDTLERITIFPSPIREKITSGTDRKMAVIADVHTDPTSKQVLEEGVGNAFVIYVVVRVEDGIKITRGSVFSYYEFKWPMKDRLTDEKWQEILKAGKEPPLPAWTDSFVIK